MKKQSSGRFLQTPLYSRNLSHIRTKRLCLNMSKGNKGKVRAESTISQRRTRGYTVTFPTIPSQSTLTCQDNNFILFGKLISQEKIILLKMSWNARHRAINRLPTSIVVQHNSYWWKGEERLPISVRYRISTGSFSSSWIYMQSNRPEARLHDSNEASIPKH